jgi:hypothetical protein
MRHLLVTETRIGPGIGIELQADRGERAVGGAELDA